jgi:diacylglycerol kinase (ATP)
MPGAIEPGAGMPLRASGENMKICIVINPYARKVDDEMIREVETATGRLGTVSIRTTEKQGEALKLAQQASEDGVDLVIAAGGDGTINEVVNGLARDFGRTKLGILPLGTGNDFARSINIPGDIDAAIDIILSARFSQVDVVRVVSDTTRHFINMSAGGFSGQVDENLTDEMKASWGPMAYLRSGLETLPDLTAYETRLRFEEEEHQEMDTYNIIVANARYIGGGIPIAPHALLDDGLMDVIIVPVASMAQLVVLVPQILLGQHMDSRSIMFRRAKKLSIHSKPGMWINVDGELIGKEPISFEVLPRALNVITGPEPEGILTFQKISGDGED